MDVTSNQICLWILGACTALVLIQLTSPPAPQSTTEVSTSQQPIELPSNVGGSSSCPPCPPCMQQTHGQQCKPCDTPEPKPCPKAPRCPPPKECPAPECPATKKCPKCPSVNVNSASEADAGADPNIFAKTAWDAVHDKTLLYNNARDNQVGGARQALLGVSGVEYHELSSGSAADEINSVVSQRKGAGAPVFVLKSIDAFCSILQKRRQMQGNYILAWFSINTNYGFLSSEIWPIKVGQGKETLLIENVLPHCDENVRTYAKVVDLLDQPTLVEFWVNQGVFFSHRKLRMLPLGPASVTNTQEYLAVVPDKESLPERDQWLYMNFNGNGPDTRQGEIPMSHRLYVTRTLEKNFPGVKNQYHNMPSFESWKGALPTYNKALLKARFCASPRGWGTDSFRHWEVLLFGCIPLVEVTGTESAFDGFPHITVSDWTKITPSYLKARWKEMMFAIRNSPHGGSIDLRAYERFTIEYYNKRIKALAEDVDADVY